MPLFYELDELEPDRRTRVAANLLALREALTQGNDDPDQRIPPKNTDDTLLLATWNLQAFDGGDADNRTDESYWYIAEIMSHFDLIAVQEVGADLGGLEKLEDMLGPTWDHIVTDVTKGTAGNGERLAFLFDTRKVLFGGLAGEIVVPPVEENRRTIAPSNQLVRTPQLVGFTSGWFKFMLTTVHIIWGEDEENSPLRVEEIRTLAQFLKERTEEEGVWSQNSILLGDFNIFSREPHNEAYQAFADNGFLIPDKLQTVPHSNVGSEHRFYDQIAMRTVENNLTPTGKAGVFDYFEVVYRDEDFGTYIPDMSGGYPPDDRRNGLTFNTKGNPRSDRAQKSYYRTSWRRRQMSDHLPMWVELKIDHGLDYLNKRSL